MSVTFEPKDQKADPRITAGYAMENLLKTDEFRIFLEEVTTRRNRANWKYIAEQANEGNRQRVIAFDEVLGIPEFLKQQMRIALLTPRKV